MKTLSLEKLKSLAHFMELECRYQEFPNPQLNRWVVEKDGEWQPMRYNVSWNWLIPVFSKFMKENGCEPTHNHNTFSTWHSFMLFVQNDDVKQAFETMYFAIEYMKREKLPENILKPDSNQPADSLPDYAV